MTQPHPPSNDERASNFISDALDEALQHGELQGPVTRFPPEPNGFLHLGHAKALCLNFGMAQKTASGRCHLRFDDTNPSGESEKFVDSIRQDVRWMGFEWGEHEYFASASFDRLYAIALDLIERGLAYVDSRDIETIRQTRGDFYRPGEPSPFRERSAEENLKLFVGMREGQFPDGSHVLRAKIDMASKDLKLRDPLMYRIRRAHHYRTKEEWPIYPMYDFAHGLCDALEGVTHSFCTLEFQNHRTLYDWFIANVPNLPSSPKQMEFARLNVSYTVLSKRKLQTLVDKELVSGWDDPRMPTLAGMRRRGYSSEVIRQFCERIGVSKRDGFVDVSLLEHLLREDLNASTRRVMAVLRPLKVTITNFPEDTTEELEAPYYPNDASFGSRMLPFTRELYIERDDFLEDPPKKWFRLTPGGEVRLRYACIIRCEEVVRDAEGNVTELRCTWDPDSRGGSAADGRKVRGTLHWVSAKHASPARVVLYDRLFLEEEPAERKDFLEALNPDSQTIIDGAMLEPSLRDVNVGEGLQFERLGYFCRDAASAPGTLVFNRTIGLRDSWAKAQSR